jgi:hypothetical protein
MNQIQLVTVTTARNPRQITFKIHMVDTPSRNRAAFTPAPKSSWVHRRPEERGFDIVDIAHFKVTLFSEFHVGAGNYPHLPAVFFAIIPASRDCRLWSTRDRGKKTTAGPFYRKPQFNDQLQRSTQKCEMGGPGIEPGTFWV